MAIRVLVVLAIVGHATSARADWWIAPAGCPDVDQITTRIGQRASGPLAALENVRVDIQRDGRRFIARLVVDDASEQRTLNAQTCDELADAVAIILARYIDASPPVEPASDPELPVLAMLPAVTTHPRDTAAPMEVVAPIDEPAHVPWEAGVRLRAVSSVGTQPGFGLGAEVAAFIASRPLFAEAAFASWDTRTVRMLEGSNARVDISLRAGSARVGLDVTPRVELWLGGEAGVMRGVGVALPVSRAGSGTWIAALAGAAVSLPIAAAVRVRGSLELGVPLARPRFALESGNEVYRSAPVTARGALGVEFRWR